MTTDGQRLSFAITEIGETAVTGSRMGEVVQLTYEQVALVEVSRVDAGRTVRNVLLGTAATLGAGLLILMAIRWTVDSRLTNALSQPARRLWRFAHCCCHDSVRGSQGWGITSAPS